MRKRWRWALAVLLALLVVAAGLVVWRVRRAWPVVAGELPVAALQGRVEVLRDRWGVPHLYAGNRRDLYVAQGYVHAQDRLWQMEMGRRAGLGTLAEVLGEPVRGLDRSFRGLGFRHAAELEEKRLDPESRMQLEAYVAGVNAYLESHRGRLAVEFALLRVEPEPWTPRDVLAATKVLFWILSENAPFELSRAQILAQAGEDVMRALIPPYSEGAPVIVPPEAGGYTWLAGARLDDLAGLAGFLGTPGPQQGSNNWVIHGRRTESGRPILANDTHLELFMPSVWYALGLHGGDIDAVGFSLAGTPGILTGHNRRIAWGISDMVPDSQDLYLEEVDDREVPRRYRFDGQWRDLELVEETLRSRGGPPETVTLRFTHRGPLVNAFIPRARDLAPMSLAWVGHRGRGAMVAAIDRLQRAGSWDEFRHALEPWDGPHLNFVYADVDGNIGYQASGLVPLRAAHHDGALPVPGTTGEYDWRGFIPFDELPWRLNPPEGYLFTANHKVVGDDYPYRLGYEYADPYRALRIGQVLAGQGAATLESSAQLQGDTYHLPAEALRSFLLSVPPRDDREREALQAVTAWNLRADPDQTGAAIYQAWYRFLVQDLVGDELGADLTRRYLEYYWVHGPVMARLLAAGDSPLFDDRGTPEREDREAIVARSFYRAVEWLAAELGPQVSDWRWGRLHTLTFRHRPVGLAEVPLLSRLFNGPTLESPGGDRFTVNVAWFTLYDDHPFGADAGAAQRLLVDVGEWDRALAINSTGQSEHLFHPNRSDQTPLWHQLEYIPLRFSRAAVEEAAVHTLTLVGGAGPAVATEGDDG
jgi:penicillin amidase